MDRYGSYWSIAIYTQLRTGIFTSGLCGAKIESFYVFRDLPKFRILEARLEGPSNLTWVHSPPSPLLEAFPTSMVAKTLPERISWGSL